MASRKEIKRTTANTSNQQRGGMSSKPASEKQMPAKSGRNSSSSDRS